MALSLESVRGMARSEVLSRLRAWFDVRELVCPHIWGRFGDGSWVFLDTDLLRVLLWFRVLVDRPVTVNTWLWGGSYDERGLRCNRCGLVCGKDYCYLSMHIFGKAVDCTVEGMSASEVRSLVLEHADSLPCGVRLEDDVSWVHMDVRSDAGSGVVLF